MQVILKQSIILSLIAGAVAGILLLIPFLMPLVFLLLFVVFGVGLVVYLKKKSMVGYLTLQDASLLGAVAGFCSFISSMAVFLPLLWIFSMIFGKYKLLFGMGSSFSLMAYNLFFTAILVVFVALLSSIFNAFTGMVAAYIYEKIEDRPFESYTNFEIDQND